jgi:hypothetical protein
MKSMCARSALKFNTAFGVVALLIRHKYIALRRHHNFTAGLLKLVLQTLPMFYLGACVALVSIYLGEALTRVWGPAMLGKFNTGIISFYSVLVILRLFFDSNSLRNLRCYLVLPIPRARLANAFLLQGLLTWLTLLPFCFFLPFWYTIILSSTEGIAGFFWLTKLLMLSGLTYLLSIVGRILLLEALLSFLLICSISAALLYAGYAANGTFLLLSPSDWLFNPVTSDDFRPVAVLILLTHAMSKITSRMICHRMTVDAL